MNRREFLRSTLAASALYSVGGFPAVGRIASASSFAPLGDRTLVNVLLDGGPDFRYLFAPAFDADTLSFGYRYWQANGAAHDIEGNANAWEQRWGQDYSPAGQSDFEFGILNNCGWLKSMWDAGNVAIVSNVFNSSSRDHAHSVLVLEQGNRSSGPANSLRPGWGGRLASACDGNVVALTRTPRPFCFGPDPSDPENRSDDWLVAAQDVRNMQLFEPDQDEAETAAKVVMTRALQSYYSAARDELPDRSLRARFTNLERQLRDFGGPLDERMQDLPIPQEIAALYDEAAPVLYDPYFGEQIRNLHDSLAVNDIFGMRIASMEYKGFDTHEGQREALEVRLEDIFGIGKGMDSLWKNLPDSARANTVFAFAGEFGRQIRANGDGGTDHGEGSYVIFVGESVNGGVYGDMFPEAELSRLEDPTPQIEGLSAIDHVFGAVCDWMQPGAGDVVFPERATAPLEAGVDLSALFV